MMNNALNKDFSKTKNLNDSDDSSRDNPATTKLDVFYLTENKGITIEKYSSL